MQNIYYYLKETIYSNQIEAENTHILIFIILLVAIWIPLIILTALLIKQSYSKLIKSILTCLSILFPSIIIGLSTWKFGYPTNRYILSISESEIIQQPNSWFLCSHFDISLYKGHYPFQVWSSKSEVPKVIKKNITFYGDYSVYIKEPIIIPYNLKTNDIMKIQFAKSFNGAIYLEEDIDNMERWLIKYNKNHSCCEESKIMLFNQSFMYKSNFDEQIFIIILQNNTLNSSHRYKTKRVVIKIERELNYIQECDAILCNSSKSHCIIDSQSENIGIGMLLDNFKSIPPVSTNIIQIECIVKDWFFYVIFGFVPLILLLIILFIINFTTLVEYHSRNKKKFTELRMDLV